MSFYEFDIIDNNIGLKVDGEYVWNEINDVVVFILVDIFIGNVFYKLYVNVWFDKWLEGIVVWILLFDSGKFVE